MGTDILILTALREEQAALLEVFPEAKAVRADGEDIRSYYTIDLPVAQGGAKWIYKIATLGLLNMGRVQAALATNDAIRRFQPSLVLMIGIAGGNRENHVELGDVLIADSIVDYELQKLRKKGAVGRTEVFKTSGRMLGWTQTGGAKWLAKCSLEGHPKPHMNPALRFGPMLSGDKVDASGQVMKRHLEMFDKTIGIEMEAGGAAAACFYAARRPEFFMIRGVSDLADPQKDSRRIASYRGFACAIAARFSRVMLNCMPRLNDTSITTLQRGGGPKLIARFVLNDKGPESYKPKRAYRHYKIVLELSGVPADATQVTYFLDDSFDEPRVVAVQAPSFMKELDTFGDFDVGFIVKKHGTVQVEGARRLSEALRDGHASESVPVRRRGIDLAIRKITDR